MSGNGNERWWQKSILLILGCSLASCLPPLKELTEVPSDEEVTDTDTVDTENESDINPPDSETDTSTEHADTGSETDTANVSDSETEKATGVEDDIMPNIQGFIFDRGDAKLSIQGGWYWYKSEASSLNEIYVKADQQNYYWLGSNYPKPDYDKAEQRIIAAEKIHAEGTLALDAGEAQYIALGFELCSPQGDDPPYEFPYTLGRCEINRGLTHADTKLLGITFKIVGDSDSFTKLEVQFKERGTEDAYQPYCVFYNPALPDPDGGDDNRCEILEKGNAVDPSLVSASVNNVVAVRTNKTTIPVNLTMVQAIHFQVYNESNQAVSFTLSDIKAFGMADDNGWAEHDTQVDIDTSCPDAGIADRDEMYDAGWVSPLPGDASDLSRWDEYEYKPFEIMAGETTVKQYLDCVEARVCDDDMVNAWETCNVHRYEDTNDGGLLDKAANCINWCQAKDFCNWIGGYLPLEEQWKLAARGSINDNPSDLYPWGDTVPSCHYAIMNDEKGVDCGSVDRMPGEGYTTKYIQTETGICNIAGNLWEWVEDSYPPSDVGHSWQASYKKIKGGSLNSKAEALLIDSYSLEHPTQPHSPTRLGFRCVRNVPDDNVASTP